jgi:alkylhydroperoxidase family enzyme
MRLPTARCVVLTVTIICGALALVSDSLAQGPAPRVSPVPESQWTDDQRMIAEAFAADGMRNAVATWLHYPVLAQALMPHVRYITRESTLPPRHRHLLALRTAWLGRSQYLWAHLAFAARQSGLSTDDLTRIGRGPEAPGWDAFERTLLRAGDELHLDSFISDATWKALGTQYDIRQLIDTIDTVGALTMHAGALNSLGVLVEPDRPDRLPAGIPYAHAATRTNIRLEGREPRIPPADAPGGRAGGANVFRTFNRNPPADRVRGAINTHVNSRALLTPKHRELLLMRIGVLCRSEYEYAAHARIGRKLGMTDDEVARIVYGPDSRPGGDPVEILLLQATDQLFENDMVAAGTWAKLAAALDTRQMLDMLIAVGGYRSTSLLINSAGVQLDPDMANFRFPPDLR